MEKKKITFFYKKNKKKIITIKNVNKNFNFKNKSEIIILKPALVHYYPYPMTYRPIILHAQLQVHKHQKMIILSLKFKIVFRITL